jgi:AraC family ethanolamine operon transcriptional activator
LSELSFYEYVDAIRIAHVVYLKAGPTTGAWEYAWCPLRETVLQFGSDGSARIVHGTTPRDISIFIFQSTQYEKAVIIDGQLTHWSELIVLPPEQYFTFVSDIPLSWIAVSLPMAVAERLLSGSRNRSGNARGHNRLTAKVPEMSMRQLVRLAENARSMSRNDTRDKGEIEAALLSKLSVLMDVAIIRDRPPNSLLSSEKIIRNALGHVERNEGTYIHVDDLVNAAQVEYRTLLRAFQHYLQITPKRYLKLRQLNLVHRALDTQRGSLRDTIDVMADFGITEFGRFATEYKRLFGELPSETLRKR